MPWQLNSVLWPASSMQFGRLILPGGDEYESKLNCLPCWHLQPLSWQGQPYRLPELHWSLYIGCWCIQMSGSEHSAMYRCTHLIDLCWMPAIGIPSDGYCASSSDFAYVTFCLIQPSRSWHGVGCHNSAMHRMSHRNRTHWHFNNM